MVGGPDYESAPFNLATQGHRQPGSSIKPFTLVTALMEGFSAYSPFYSEEKNFPVPGSPGERFIARNYEGLYSGQIDLESATINSDNSVFAELGLEVGTKRIAAVARRLGVETPLSTNPAMTLGGLELGVTPLEWAYAYSTLANDGNRVWGTLGPSSRSPVSIERVEDPDGKVRDENRIRRTRVIPYDIAQQAKSILAGVITSGTGTAAQIDEFAAGKTGTTENYGDAWFVGFNKELTVAVWVGYPDRLKPMLTEYRGQPVAGGTYPAEIWRDFMTAWIGLRDARQAERDLRNGKEPTTTTPAPLTTTPTTTPTETAPAPAEPEQESAPAPTREREAAPAPAPEPEPEPAPEPEPTPAPPEGGGGTPPPATAAPAPTG
jgi:penicillin-binding protein 1A